MTDSRAWRNLVNKHKEGRRAGDNGWQREDAAADEEMEEMLPKVAPTVTYVDIPTDERGELRPITPPLSSVNFTSVCEPLDPLQRKDAAEDEAEEMLPQVAPTVPADKHREMYPPAPPSPSINFTDLREPLDLLTQ